MPIVTAPAPLVLYHNDADGFCAAWVAAKHLPADTEFRAVQYGELPPHDIHERDLYVLDFSYPQDVMHCLKAVAASLTVLDHHETARDAVEVVGGTFDPDRSGAMLAWRYFEIGRAPDDSCAPPLVRYVQDRDLWWWALPHSREINAALASYPFEFATWDRLSVILEKAPGVLRGEGEAILRYQSQMVGRIAAKTETVAFHGESVPCVNTSVLQSEVGQELAHGAGIPFSLSWFHIGAKYVVSLRSASEGVDVAAIAKAHGGGGHKHAAGFECDRLPWFEVSAPVRDLTFALAELDRAEKVESNRR